MAPSLQRMLDGQQHFNQLIQDWLAQKKISSDQGY